jgi:putative SOS response-associated peptidase YedK
MASLYRCRGSRDELASLFDCKVDRKLTWQPQMRPGQAGLVICRHGSRRIARAMRWGIPPPGESGGEHLWTELDPFSNAAFGNRENRPRRCLIVLDSFALPDGARGQRTRSWFGLWDEPLFAWAGLWREVDGHGPSFIGASAHSNRLVRRVGSIMPVILRPADHERWLFGSVRDALRLWRACSADLMWLERTDELWSSGLCLHELEAERAFAGEAGRAARSPAR